MSQVKRVIVRYASSNLLDEFTSKIELANDTGDFDTLSKYEDSFFEEVLDIVLQSSDRQSTFDHLYDTIDDIIDEIKNRKVRNIYKNSLSGIYNQFPHW